MHLLKLLFDFDALLGHGPDVVAYAIMALVGSGLFLIRLGIAAFLGGDDGFDTDLDGADSDSAFGFFSVLSILAFFMGAGWMGLACRIDWDLNGLITAVVSSGFGIAMMLFSSGLMYMTRKLNAHKDYDVTTAIGAIGRVYLTIPAKGEGSGEVQVTVSGRQKIMRALSTGPKLEAFTDVRIVEARPDETMVVEPADG